MATWMLTNGNGYNMFPESMDELRRGLSEVDALARSQGRPRVVVLTPDGNAEDVPHLSVGVGSDESVLVFEPGDHGSGGGFSKGARTGDTTEVWFAYGTGDTPYFAWMLIPTDTAFAAVVEFFRTGERPTSIDWGDV